MLSHKCAEGNNSFPGKKKESSHSLSLHQFPNVFFPINDTYRFRSQLILNYLIYLFQKIVILTVYCLLTYHVLCAHCLQGVISLGSFSAQHDAVSSIQHSVGYVAAFSTGGSGLLDHALQHLTSIWT